MSKFRDKVRSLTTAGKSRKEIAAELKCKPATIKEHQQELRKLGELPPWNPPPAQPGFAARRILSGRETPAHEIIGRLLRYAYGLCHSGRRPEAASFLIRAAERAREPECTNLLALSDLIAGSPADQPLGYRDYDAAERTAIAIAYGHLPG